MSNCPLCGDKLPDLKDSREERKKATVEKQLERERINQLLPTIKITSTNTFQNAIIVEYLDVISSGIVLGTGFLSSVGADFADFFGTRAKGYQDKLAQAVDVAKNELKFSAATIGANAIVGIDIDFNIMNNDVIMVVASGTAVKIKEEN